MPRRRGRDDDYEDEETTRDDDEDVPRRRRRAEADEEPAPRSRRGRSRDDDDDEDEAPRGRSRRGRDDDEDDRDEEPRGRGRGRSRSRDEDEDEDRPRSRRGRDRDDEDDDDDGGRPRSRRSRDDDEDERPSSRRRGRSYDDSDEDDRPRRGRQYDDDDAPRRGKTQGGGWGNTEANRAETSDYANEVKLTDEDQVLLFLDPEPPFAPYLQHWCKWLEGKKSWTCLRSFIDPKTDEPMECPLCDVSVEKSSKAAFNVAILTPGGRPVNAVLIAGTMLQDKLKALDLGKQGPLTENYFACSQTGSSGKAGGGKTQYSVTRIKDRDLKEDYGVKPVTDAEFDRLVEDMYDGDDFPDFHSYKELKAIAREMMG